MFYVRNNHRVALCGLTVLAAIGASAAAPLGHRNAVPLGDLMCRLQQVNQTDAAGSTQTRSIDCVYQSLKGGVEEFYTGTLSTIGSNDPQKNQSVLAWVVRGPKDSDSQPGALAQSYTAGAGTPEEAAQSLVGDTRMSIILLADSPRHDASPPAPIIAAMQLELKMAPA
jgi:Protein of unknown function (DUF992)